MPLDIATPPGAEVRRDFKLYGGLSKAYTRKTIRDGVEIEEMILEGIASSTARDRHGDTITARAQAMMLEKLQGGNGGKPLAMFLNHEYIVPEDVLGSCEESELTASKDDAGNDVIDLKIICRVTGENPRAVQAWKIVKDGVTLGYSIGGGVTECEVDEENDDGTSWCPPLIIDGIDLFEISLCGIPANPRSYTDAAKSFVKENGLRENAPEPTKDWARIMRLGFVRNATRNAEVRAQLRKALPALRGTDVAAEPAEEQVVKTVVQVPVVDLACSACDFRQNDVAEKDADQVVRDHNDDAHDGEQPDFERTAHAIDVEKDDDGGGMDESLPAHAQSAVAMAIGCLSEAMSHGACGDAMESMKKAHAGLVALLAPGDDADGAGDSPAVADPDDSPTPVADPGDDAAKALTITLSVDTAEAQRKLAEVGEAITARAAELAEIDAAVAKRADEAAASEKQLSELRTELVDVQAKVDAAKAQPAGRHTAAATVQRGAPSSLYEAQRRLGAAIVGGGSTNPTQRPA